MVGVTVLGIVGFVVAGFGSSCLLWLHGMRKLSDATGTVVADDREDTAGGYWKDPVAGDTTPGGTQVRRTFHQFTRSTIDRKVLIVGDPGSPAGQAPLASMGVSREPLIYSAWVIGWLWLVTAAGLASLAGGIAIAVATG